jgi:zinc transport system ATP-binding protein
MLVKLENISFGYNGEKVLEDVNLLIRKGDFIGMIGPNGGGKSTIIKIIMGLLEPWQGRIYYGEKQSGEKIRIGYLPQYHDFDHKFPINILEVILSGLTDPGKAITRFHRSDRKKAKAIADTLGIGHITGKSIGELSGGQMQRAFLGRAIISDPELLILDEPVTYVDSKFESELYNLLEDINQKAAILLVSHDLGQITSSVKTIACVNRHLHYHPSNKIDKDVLSTYNCPVELITHGRVPHRVLKDHV